MEEQHEQEKIPIAQPVLSTPSTQPAPIPVQSASTRAVAALVLGILSLLCMGLLAGIPAIIIGSLELRDIKAGVAPAAGESVAKVGYILGIIGTVLTCLSALAFAAMMALGISLGSMEALQNLQSV